MIRSNDDDSDMVLVGLIMCAVTTVAAGIVSILDPFNNGINWVNWLMLSLAAAISIILAVIMAANTTDNSSYWGSLAGGWIASAIIGGVLASVATTEPGSGYASLVWSAYGTQLFTLIIAGMVMYLVGASR